MVVIPQIFDLSSTMHMYRRMGITRSYEHGHPIMFEIPVMVRKFNRANGSIGRACALNAAAAVAVSDAPDVGNGDGDADDGTTMIVLMGVNGDAIYPLVD